MPSAAIPEGGKTFRRSLLDAEWPVHKAQANAAMSPGRRPVLLALAAAALSGSLAVRRLGSLPSSRCHDLCCYGSLLVMSPSGHRGDHRGRRRSPRGWPCRFPACRATSWDSQKAARSARVSIWIGRSRRRRTPEGILNERTVPPRRPGSWATISRRRSRAGAGVYAMAGLAEALS